ncbi:hypothetical protein GLN3_14745 [Geobacillus lituanicus]|nr:hypothetical protein GLN3_14745 [Geobacillus lituanicus]
MPEKFDCIVVGAGPAGTACAYELAKAGVNVLLLERGEYPGSKNVMGGVLYRKMMEGIIPEFYKEAPLERPIVEQRFMLMDKESAVTFSYKGLEWGREPYNNYVGYEGCHECGSCRIGCPYENIRWEYPRGGHGIVFRLG